MASADGRCLPRAKLQNDGSNEAVVRLIRKITRVGNAWMLGSSARAYNERCRRQE